MQRPQPHWVVLPISPAKSPGLTRRYRSADLLTTALSSLSITMSQKAP